MKMDIHEKQFTSDVVAKAAGCVEGTLRQWRNRHGFLSETLTGGMEVKYFYWAFVPIMIAIVLHDAKRMLIDPVPAARSEAAPVPGNPAGAYS